MPKGTKQRTRKKTKNVKVSVQNHLVSQNMRCAVIKKFEQSGLSKKKFVKIYNESPTLQIDGLPRITSSFHRWESLSKIGMLPEYASDEIKRSTHQDVIDLCGSEREEIMKAEEITSDMVTQKLRVNGCLGSDLIEIREVEGMGFGVFALQDIPAIPSTKRN